MGRRGCGLRELAAAEADVRGANWRQEGLAVETGSFTYHRGLVAFEDDHARDLDLRAAGLAVLRFTERQLEKRARARRCRRRPGS